MIAFDAENPFPLLPEGSLSYAEAQVHSAQVDHWLGIEAEKVEAALQHKYPDKPPAGSTHALWIGLPVKTLLTPYSEIHLILSLLGLRAGDAVVDLGAGYGRMGFVIAKHFPGVRFVGYEKVTERVAEGNRCFRGSGLAEPASTSIELLEADLASSEFQPLSAPFYFIYDYSVPTSLEKTLQDLRTVARSRSITVVGRGRSSRQKIEQEHPWLSGVIAPEHHGTFSIYRS